MRAGGIGPMTTTAADTSIASLAKKAGNTSTAGDNRACFNRGSRKNGGSNGMPPIEGRVCSKEPLCHGHRQKGEKELL